MGRPLSKAILSVWMAILALAFALPAHAQTVERFGGTGRIGDDPAFPVHAEFAVEGTRATGRFTSPGSVFEVVDGRVEGAVFTGKLKGDGASGEFTLRVEGKAARGTFSIEGAPGTLDLQRTDKSAEQAFGPPKQNLALSPAEWTEDLDELVRILTKEHGAPFHRVSRSAFEAQVAAVRDAIGTKSGAQVALEFRRLAMLIGDGHTEVSLPRGSARYPIRTFWFDDGLRVVSAGPDHHDLLGAKVVAIGGVPVARVIKRLRPYSPLGENAWSYRAVLAFLVDRPEVLEAQKIAGPGPAQWTFALAKGGKKTVTLTPAKLTASQLAPLGGGLNLWEQQPDEPMWTAALPEHGALYVNFRSYDDLAARSAALFQQIDAQKPGAVIIDLRDNGGGDYHKGREHLVAPITARPWLNRPDRLYVLVGRHTFSAAMSNAADFRYRTNATLVGEPVGEKPNSWQESRSFYLPHSGLRVAVSTKFYEFAPKGTDAVTPQVYAPPRAKAWGTASDPALDAIWARRKTKR